MHTLLAEAANALGAEVAAFVSFVRDDKTASSCRFMVACDARWCQEYLATDCLRHDPWLAYAARHTETVVASAVLVTGEAQQRVVDLAARAGFASAVLMPAHSPAGKSRVSLLCLGSATPGYFEGEGFGQLRICARAISHELHEWWTRRVDEQLKLRAKVSAPDLLLLWHEHQGHSTKQIARELQLSPCAINSRFQRINVRMGVPNRRKAAALAVECGLLLC